MKLYFDSTRTKMSKTGKLNKRPEKWMLFTVWLGGSFGLGLCWNWIDWCPTSLQRGISSEIHKLLPQSRHFGNRNLGVVCIELTGFAAQKEEKGGGQRFQTQYVVILDAVCGHMVWKNLDWSTILVETMGPENWSRSNNLHKLVPIYDIGLTWN